LGPPEELGRRVGPRKFLERSTRLLSAGGNPTVSTARPGSPMAAAPPSVSRARSPGCERLGRSTSRLVRARCPSPKSRDAAPVRPEGPKCGFKPVLRFDHHVCEFLGVADRRSPRLLVEMLMRRVARCEADHARDFRPLPFEGLRGAFNHLPGDAEHHALLRLVRDDALPASGWRRYQLPELYPDVSGNYAPPGLSVLDEWFASGDPDRVEAAARLLCAAPPAFVFDQVDFVAGVLDRDEQVGDECRVEVAGQLYRSAVHRSKQGAAGRPFPAGCRTPGPGFGCAAGTDPQHAGLSVLRDDAP
jgi:hypothetical protein